MSKKRLTLFAIWLLVALLFWWAWRDVSFAALAETLGRLDWSAWIILFLVNAAILLLFSSRWWLIVSALGHPVPYLALARYRLASFGVSYFTPGPHFGGEPLQVYFLKTRHHIPTDTALASVSLDKIIELLANFTFLSLGILLVVWKGLFFQNVSGMLIFFSAGTVALLFAYLVALLMGKTPLAWTFDRLPLLKWNQASLGAFRQTLLGAESQVGLFCRQKPLVIIQSSILSALIWLAMLGEYALALYFLGLETSLLNILALMLFARLAFLTPIPAGLGALEAGQVFSMQSIGFDTLLGVSISLIIRGRDTLFGLLGLWLGSLSVVLDSAPTQTKSSQLQKETHVTLIEKSLEKDMSKKRETNCAVCARIPTRAGEFQLCVFDTPDNKEHLSISMGEVQDMEDVFVRVHSECFTGDVLGSQRCDCGEQLQTAMGIIAAKETGILIYLRQEGRGIGLAEKLKAYNLQDEGYDTVEANLMLGHQADERDYTVAAEILKQLGVKSIRLITNNPAKIDALTKLGVQVSGREPLVPTINAENEKYLQTKVQKMHHLLSLNPS
jgi:GTP cyclohydrolase II